MMNWNTINPIDIANESQGVKLWQKSVKWRRCLEPHLAEHQLTFPQFMILAAIYWLTRNGEIATQAHIAQYCSIDVTITSQIIRKFEKEDVVIRQSHPSDERAKYPHLTVNGARLVQQGLAHLQKVDHQIFSAPQQTVSEEELTRKEIA